MYSYLPYLMVIGTTQESQLPEAGWTMVSLIGICRDAEGTGEGIE